MLDSDISRRKAIAALGATAASALGVGYGIHEITSRQSRPGGSAAETDSGSESGSSGTTASDPDALNLVDFGATVDGTTDDTSAFEKALDAIEPGGTLRLPPGDIVISSKQFEEQAAVLFSESIPNLTIEGDGPLRTRINMAAGHENNYIGFRAMDSVDMGGLTFRNLQLNGNWRNQSAQNGFGFEIRGDGVEPITLENCRISNWGTNGGNLNTNAVIRSCDFIGNGRGAARYDRLGHGINVTLDALSDETLLVENCLFRNNTGAAIDSQRGEITFRNTVVEKSGYGFKHHEDTYLTVENCKFRDISSRPWYMIPGRQRLGTVRCIDTVFENAGWPAFDFPSPADFRGDNILIVGANQNNERDGSFYARDGGDFDLGRLSIHDSAHGAALELRDCSGRIDELVHSGNPGGVGVTEGVEIGTVTQGDPISLDPPAAEDVGTT
jgi:hypothetical protein